MQSGPKKEVVLNSPRIFSPKTDCVYRLVNPAIPNLVTSITFEGDDTAECFVYDAESNVRTTRKGKSKTRIFDNVIFITQESLGYQLPKLPLNIYRNDGLMYFPKTICINFSDTTPKLNLELYTYVGMDVNTDNQKLLGECKQELESMEVNVGNYPLNIGISPSFKTLNKIFQQFLYYNTEEKIERQYTLSKGRCHMRAHFVNELLWLYHINSFKIYKYWTPDDWANFNKDKSWKYHCATLIVDDQNKKWVWDPWVNNHHKLLTLNEWVYQSGEPKPISVLIASRVVINPDTKGHIAYGSSFKDHPKPHTEAIQAVFGDAIPNPPPPLYSHGFFERNSRAIIPYQNPHDTIRKGMRKC